MRIKFKSYDPVRNQQRSKQRRQKPSANRLPSHTTYINTPPLQSLLIDHQQSQVDKKCISLTNTAGTEDPYAGFPSVEEILKLCSPPDTNISSADTPTSVNSLSYTDKDNLCSRC
jgi:hypothetical protein